MAVIAFFLWASVTAVTVYNTAVRVSGTRDQEQEPQEP
jgi:hypothetical protein